MAPTVKISTATHRGFDYGTKNNSAPADSLSTGFDLRDTLTATVVRELSFAEFRLALEQSGNKRG